MRLRIEPTIEARSRIVVLEGEWVDEKWIDDNTNAIYGELELLKSKDSTIQELFIDMAGLVKIGDLALNYFISFFHEARRNDIKIIFYASNKQVTEKLCQSNEVRKAIYFEPTAA